MENLTQEQIEKSVNAAFDSVNLINQLKQKETLTEQETDILERNIEHLKIMIGKKWFEEALTNQQKEQINDLIKD
jgi:hypothetical protein